MRKKNFRRALDGGKHKFDEDKEKVLCQLEIQTLHDNIHNEYKR